jgi:uncharacterized membrane protein YccC
MTVGRTLQGPRFRYVVKVALAALLAYALTLGKRNEFALFSALGAAMVVGGSVGEDLKSSLNRVRGTLAGTAIGIASAYLLGTSIWSLGLAAASMAWLSVGFGWGAPAMRIGLAMALVVLFSHGADPAHYAVWRAFNTLIGVAIGLAIGRFVWPIRARDEITSAVRQSLDAAASTLDALASGAGYDALLPQRVAVLDGLTAVRTARSNARVEHRVHGHADLLATHAKLAIRISIHVLGASVKFEDLARAGAAPEFVRVARQPLAPLAATVREAPGNAAHAAEFTVRLEEARAAARAADVSPAVHDLLAGILEELRQIGDALESLRDAQSKETSAAVADVSS